MPTPMPSQTLYAKSWLPAKRKDNNVPLNEGQTLEIGISAFFSASQVYLV